MKILGIETSCDDTAAAIIEAKGGFNNPSFSVLSNVSYSQIAIHKKFGGIVPSLASRAHLQKISPTVKASLSRFNLDSGYIDLIAVTRGPGLLPSLLVGVNFARALAYKWQKPLIGVNHIEGHIYSNWLFAQNSSRNFVRRKKKIEFPALILIVSGGHTELVLMRDYGRYKIIGETLDDAAGEAFDKTARILGLGFPGGPAIAAEAEKLSSFAKALRDKKIKLPRPMINSKDYNFSFSGLKTAVLYSYKGKNKSAMAFETQQAITDVLIAKTLKAARNFNPKSIMIAGGVSANKKLREDMTLKLKSYKIPFFVPALPYTTDNAAMIAASGYFNYLKKKPRLDSWKKIVADANLRL